MITKFRIDEETAKAEFGMACQRLIPWTGQADEPPMGLMACFLGPGASSEPDCHDEDEVMLILAGKGVVDLGGRTTSATTHDLVVLPGNTVHTVHNDGAEQLVWVSLYWHQHTRRTV